MKNLKIEKSKTWPNEPTFVIKLIYTAVKSLYYFILFKMTMEIP